MTRIMLCALALLSSATAAPAATLIATPIDVNTFFSGFQIVWTDANRNDLVEFDEITSFSGLTQTLQSNYPAQQPYLSILPEITNISVAGAAPGADGPPYLWMFSGSSPSDPQVGGSTDSWTYEITLTADPLAPIPLPAPAFLLAAALAGLAGLRGAARRLAGRREVMA
jgi:hypothetical protein